MLSWLNLENLSLVSYILSFVTLVVLFDFAKVKNFFTKYITLYICFLYQSLYYDCIGKQSLSIAFCVCILLISFLLIRAKNGKIKTD